VGEPLLKAIGYYLNQRDGLRRFLDDGRLRIHNNGAEGQLRNLAQGRATWRYVVNRTGLNWYTTFRSLIASCHLHGLNPPTYLEEGLRLAPHWPATQMLALSPKYWAQTRAALNAAQLDCLRSPWDKFAAQLSPLLPPRRPSPRQRARRSRPPGGHARPSSAPVSSARSRLPTHTPRPARELTTNRARRTRTPSAERVHGLCFRRAMNRTSARSR